MIFEPQLVKIQYVNHFYYFPSIWDDKCPKLIEVLYCIYRNYYNTIIIIIFCCFFFIHRWQHRQMAAVSQHAMRRHHAGEPFDASRATSGTPFYAVSHQPVSILLLLLLLFKSFSFMGLRMARAGYFFKHKREYYMLQLVYRTPFTSLLHQLWSHCVCGFD